MTTPNDELRLYGELVAEMDELRSLSDLSREQAERWASLSGTRLALYLEPDGWMHKALQRMDGRWELVQMWGPLDTPGT